MKILWTIQVVFAVTLLGGCGGQNLKLNTVEKTQKLQPGMMHEEVVVIMGKPASTQFVGDKVVLKYKLHEYWKGWVPYYLAFDKGSAKLVSWYADEAEFQQNQQQWTQAFQAFEQSMQAAEQANSNQNSGSGGESGSGQYMEGYDPNANYYTNDSYWEGSGYHYED